MFFGYVAAATLLKRMLGMPLIPKVQPQQLQLRQQQNAVTVDQGSEVEMCKTNTASTATAAAAAAVTLATLATNQNAVVVQTKKSLFQTLDPFIVARSHLMQSQHLTDQSISTHAAPAGASSDIEAVCRRVK